MTDLLDAPATPPLPAGPTEAPAVPGDPAAHPSSVAARLAACRPHRPGGRLRALDVLRGLTVAGMIVVNEQGDGAHGFWGTAHASWHGWTFADLVFPSFLFIVGASLAYALARHDGGSAPSPLLYVRMGRRVGVLCLLGLVISGMGAVPWADLHLLGVLQRIALCYLVVALIALHVERRAQWVLGAGLLLAYWALLTLVPVPGHGAGALTPNGNIVGWFDRLVLGQRHLYKGGPSDPEGLLSTIPAVVTTLIGYWSARWLRRQPVDRRAAQRLACVGGAMLAAGLMWGLVLPINKRLWTPSYVVLTAGVSLLLLAATFALVDIRRSGRLAQALAILGMNAIVVYVASEELGARLDDAGWRRAIYRHAYLPVGTNLGSLLYSLTFLATLWLVLAAMHHRRWYVKV